MRDYWDYLLKLPLDEYTKPQVYPTKADKMPPGEVCKKTQIVNLTNVLADIVVIKV